MVSRRTLLTLLSIAFIAWLLFSLVGLPLLEYLSHPFPRQQPYDDVPALGAGVTIETGDNTPLVNITYDNVPLNITWIMDPIASVAVVSPDDPPRYWRRTAYDNYTGSEWIKSDQETWPLAEVAPEDEVVYTVTMNITHGVGGTLPLLTLWPTPLIISGSIQSSLLTGYNLTQDSYGTVLFEGRFSRNGSSQLSYQVTFTPLNWSNIRPLAQSASLTPPELSRYRSQGLDRLSASTRADIQARLATILEGVPDNAFEEAFAILDYFKSTFAFDPEAGRPGQGEETVAWFLEHERGIGLDFATAYTMFLREQGIAARPVFGAVLGQKVGNQRVLRLMHLHFWVEVYIPTGPTTGYWIQFDPTPLPDTITGDKRDPYVVSVYYKLTIDVPTPIVDRGVAFQIFATLTKDDEPQAGETIEFRDETEEWLLGTNTTGPDGRTAVTFTYNDSAVIGFHLLRVSFHAKSEYSAIALHGSANLTLQVNPAAVNRTYSVSFHGRLFDAVNGRGISSMETLTPVSILLNGEWAINATTDDDGYYDVAYPIPPDHPLGLATVMAVFSLPAVIDPVSSDPQQLNITAQSHLSLTATPNAVRINSEVVLSGYLRYDNGTGIPGRPVQILWDGSPLAVVLTDSEGLYNYTYIPTATGQVTVEAHFTGGDNVYGSGATEQVRVHELGTLAVFVDDEDGDDVTQRGTPVYCTGWVENQAGEPQGGVTVHIYFNGTEVAETTTFPNGTFAFTFQVPSTLPVGLFEVTGDVASSTLLVESTTDYIALNSSTQVLDLQFNTTRVMQGETVSFSGLLVDDQGKGVPGVSITIHIAYYSTSLAIGTATTQTDGHFQFTWTVEDFLPDTLPTLTFWANFSGATYYGASGGATELDVFADATLQVNVSPGPHPPGATIQVNGTLRDSFGRPLPNREVTLMVNGSVVGQPAITNDQGQVSFALTLPLPSQSTVLEIQLQHRTVAIITSSPELVYVQGVPVMQLPIPTELILAIVAIAATIVVVVVLVRYLKRRPRRAAAPAVDTAAMLTTLRQLLTSQKYRESILHAFKMFEIIAQIKLGLFREPSMTPREFAYLAAGKGGLDTRQVEIFVRGTEEAKFSNHPITYDTALTTLNAFASLYNHLTGGNLRFVTQEQPS